MTPDLTPDLTAAVGAGSEPPSGEPAALAGVRVVDLSQVLAGPYCTMLLGDLGADVVKVEPPEGDQSRRSLGTRRGEDCSGFLAVNRNKRSVVLDLHTTEGRRALHALVDRSDVVVENFRPGVAERLGAGYAELAERNPRLVYTSVSGFGRTGPYADRPGYDLIAQALAGLMSVTGTADGDPVKTGPPVADLAAGLFAALGTLAALLARDRTGAGQRVDTSLYQAALGLAVWETAELWATGTVPGRIGSAHRMVAPYEALRTRDGHIVVAGNTDRLWRALCATVGRPDLPADPRFAGNADRLAHRADLVAELEAALSAASTEEWVARLVAAGVPAAPVRDYGQVLADPHTAALGAVTEVAHPVLGALPQLAPPLGLAATPPAVRRPPPRLGEHTAEVLAELGEQPA